MFELKLLDVICRRCFCCMFISGEEFLKSPHVMNDLLFLLKSIAVYRPIFSCVCRELHLFTTI